MKIASNGFVATWLSILMLFATTALQAGGLSTGLGEVVVENLQVGQTYSLKELANLRLFVTNNSDDSVALKMDILSPDSSELKKGSRPIPDISWLKLSRDTFVLGPNEIALSDITLSIPDENRYLGEEVSGNDLVSYCAWCRHRDVHWPWAEIQDYLYNRHRESTGK